MKEYIYVSSELGKRIREVRKQKKFRQEDLADDLISTGTISKIECGAHQIGKGKLKHLCNKLEIKLDDLEINDTDEPQQKINDMILFMGTDMIGLIDLEEGWKELRKWKFPKDDPLTCYTYYLKARYYETKRNLRYATLNYQQCIDSLRNHTEMHITNLMAACYNALARIHYFESDYENAIIFSDLALDSFFLEGQRQHIRHMILVSKAIYLERLDRIAEAYMIVEQLWEERKDIDNTETLLNVYELRATLFNRMEKYDQSIECALVGIEKAKYNFAFDRLCELWTVLGDSLSKKGMMLDAEYAFTCALRLENRVRHKYTIISNNTKLGLLYLKMNKFRLAEEMLEKAVSLGKETEDVSHYIDALIAYGNCFYTQNKFKKAIQQWEKAQKLAEERSLVRQERIVLMKLANCCIQNDQKKYKIYVDKFLRISVQLEANEQKIKILPKTARS